MPKRVAILFYGLTRCLHKTIDSIRTNVFNVLKENGYEYDVFIHTYKIHGTYNNPWAKEKCTYVNEDVESLLNPAYSIHDNQDDVIKSINVDEYYTHLGNWTGMTPEMTKYLIRNMCLALYSKKRIANVLNEHKDRYDYVMIVRPDSLFTEKINMQYFNELTSTNIIIPTGNTFSGVNDRFCLATTDIALYYGTLFDELKEYSQRNNITSERYLMDKLNEKGINILTRRIVFDTLRITNDNKPANATKSNNANKLVAKGIPFIPHRYKR